ncbi:MAG: hypothetical protein GEU99_12665 [Luteitalea sp.]|nr:hypothetical protein [Luteitalea sp.]
MRHSSSTSVYQQRFLEQEFDRRMETTPPETNASSHLGDLRVDICGGQSMREELVEQCVQLDIRQARSVTRPRVEIGIVECARPIGKMRPGGSLGLFPITCRVADARPSQRMNL